MSIKTFWLIVIKIIAVWLLIRSVFIVPEFFATLYGVNFASFDNTTAMWGTVSLLLTISVFLLIIRYCFLKADWLIEKLRLNTGFDEDRLELNIHHTTILKITVIVIGGLIFIDSLPSLCRQIFVYVNLTHLNTYNKDPQSAGWIAFYAIKTLLGYLLMVNSRLVINMIERNRRQA